MKSFQRYLCLELRTVNRSFPVAYCLPSFFPTPTDCGLIDCLEDWVHYRAYQAPETTLHIYLNYETSGLPVRESYYAIE